MIDLDVFISEPADQYHAKAKDYLSSHALIDFMKCPDLFFQRMKGNCVKNDSSAFKIGRAAHTLILEGPEVFDETYAVGGPVNPATGKPFGPTTKKFTEWASEQSKEILTDDQVALIHSMYEGVNKNEFAIKLLKDGRPEATLRLTHRNMPSQIRIDWINPNEGIVDLKTCDDLDWFHSDTKKYKYVNQLAFYRSVLSEKIGQMVPVWIIAVEKAVPFRCGVFELSLGTLEDADGENRRAIAELKESLKSGHWPTGYENPRYL